MKRRLISAFLSLTIALTSTPISVSANAIDGDSFDEALVNTDFVQTVNSNQWDESEREPEIILRDPLLYEKIDGTDLNGVEVEHSQYSRTYLLEDNTYLTRFFDDPIMYMDENGEWVDIDNAVVLNGEEYTNSANSYDLSLPIAGESLTISKNEYQFELKPLFAPLVNPVAVDNAIRYNNVCDGVDLQYTLNGDNVKEDIILNKPIEDIAFQYEVSCDGLRLIEVDNAVYAYVNDPNEPEYIINAPYMTDNAGNVSCGVRITLNNNIITVTPDAEWISMPERAYPIIIDPTIELNSSNLEWSLVENGVGTSVYPAGPDVQHRDNPYLYSGFERGNLTGLPGLTYGETRSYIKMNYDFSVMPDGTPLPSNAIISAKLKAYKYAGQPAEGTKVFCQIVSEDWHGAAKTWNTKPLSVNFNNEDSEGNQSPSYVDVSGGKKWVEWDISGAIRYWLNGGANYGLALVPEYEDQDAVCFSGPGNAHGKEAMYFDISWTVPNAVDEEMELISPNINLRPLTETSSEGKQQLNGVFADGTVRPTLKVDYRLNNDESGTYPKAEYGRVYPDSNIFNDAIKFNIGYTGLFQSNWQSGLFTKFKNNLLYQVYATATDGNNTTPEGASDSFIVYQFTDQDTLPYVADFYGVPLDTIIADNKPQDYLGMEGNTFFIRSPQRNAEIPYTRPDNLSDDRKRQLIYANLGRGQHSEFDLEPINMNTGNYYFDSIDATSSEYNGEFTLSRSYNSIGSKGTGVFGNGWSFEYSQRISRKADGSYIYTLGDGKQLVIAYENGKYLTPIGYDFAFEKIIGDAPEQTCYTIKYENGVTYQFNCYGLLTSISDYKGYVTSIRYDNNNRLSTIVTCSGRTYYFTTNSEGQITSIVLPNNGTLKYEYKNGNLVSYTNADGDIVRYVYNDAALLTEWYDANNVCVVKNTYDDQGRVIKQIDAMGTVTRLTYNENETIVSTGTEERTYAFDDMLRITDVDSDKTDKTATYNADNRLQEITENGLTQEFEYDDSGNITKQIRNDGESVEIEYDSYGNVLSLNDYNNSVTQNEYDDKGNLLKSYKPDGSTISYKYNDHGQITSLIDGNGNETTFEYVGLDKLITTDPLGNQSTCFYDPMGRLISEIDVNGNETKTSYSLQGKKLGTWKTGDIFDQYLYDGNGNCIEYVDPMGYKTTYTYDELNRMTKAINPEGGTIKYKYDVDGNVIEKTDTSGNSTTYSYSQGKLVSETDAIGRKSAYSYDENGCLISQTSLTGDKTEYSYNSLGQVVKETLNNKTTAYTYDKQGNIIEKVYCDGGKETFEYDAVGNLLKTVDVNGLITNYSYDYNGNILTKEDSYGAKYSYVYNGNNILISETNSLDQKKTYEYDKAGRLTKYTDPLNHSTSYEYDSNGNMIKSTSPLGITNLYDYDKAGHCISETDGNGNITTYKYDGVGNLIAKIDPLNHTETYKYDSAQRLVEYKDASAAMTQYQYDKMGRLICTVDPDNYSTSMEYDAHNNIIKVVNPDESESLCCYNAQNQLIKNVTADGLITEYKYDTKGNVTKEYNNEGYSVDREYNYSDQITAEKDIEGRTKTYSYDVKGNCISVKDFNDDITSYSYDVLSNLLSVNNPDGTVIKNIYDANGNVIEQSDSEKVIVRYKYDADSRLVSETDALGNSTTYSLDKNANIVEIKQPNGGSVKRFYSAANQLLSEEDAIGNATQYMYDACGRLICLETAEGHKTEYAYDGRGNIVQEKNPLGYVTTNAYDSMGNLVKTVSPRGAETRYSYNHSGLLTNIKDAIGRTTQKEYSSDGKLIKEISPNGLEFKYQYDTLGRVIKVSDSTGLYTEIKYNNKGLVESETNNEGTVYNSYDKYGRLSTITDAANNKTTYTYDINGNLRTLTSPRGSVTTYSYDKLNRQTNVHQDGLADIAYAYDDLGNVTEVKQADKIVKTSYNLAGYKTTVTNALGFNSTYKYNKDSQVSLMSDFGGNTYSYTYDAVGNVTSIINPLGYKQTFSYDADNNVISKSDALNNSTYYRYDLVNQLVEVKTPKGNITKYSYDSMGNIVSKSNAANISIYYNYDLHNNLIKVESPDDTVEEFKYDVSSKLRETIKPDGNTIQYDYDALNNLISKSFSDETVDVRYGYDNGGNRVKMSDESGETLYNYDNLGRLTSVTDSLSHHTNYTYDQYGRVESIEYPDGRNVKYVYDLADNILEVSDSVNGSTTYTYDALGNVLSCKRPDGVNSLYSYDKLGQLTRVENKNADNTLSSFDYTYDKNGRIISEIAVQDGKESEKQFSYDAEGQVSGYTDNTDGKRSETTYKYSEAGNRIAITTGEDSETVKYVYDKSGRIVSEVSDENGSVNYTYDSNGNLIEKRSSDEVFTYSYDIENRLKAVHEGGALLMAASYDGDGNRTFQLSRKTVVSSLDYSEQGDNLTMPKKGTSGNVSSVSNPSACGDDTSAVPDKSVQRFEETYSSQDDVDTYYEKIYDDPKETIFWYGFGQGLLNFFGYINSSVSDFLSRAFSTSWEFVTGQFTLKLHSDVVDKDIETLQNIGLTDKEIAEIISTQKDVKEIDDVAIKGNDEGANTQTSKKSPLIIPETPQTESHVQYDLRYYVNNINTSNAQVLMTYGRNNVERTAYAYGVNRLYEDNMEDEVCSDYVYDGRNSVVQMVADGNVNLSMTYDPFGEINSGVDDEFVGFAFNGEETNQITGLQYLRARYYDTDMGSFITIDSYLGSITNVASQNRYSYAENDPVNKIDPSGHYSTNTSGTSQYYTSTGLNELRDYMTAAALWAGEVNAQNSFNNSIARASGTSFMNYSNINGISQSTVDSYINQGIIKASVVSVNYGCEIPTLAYNSIETFETILNQNRNNANNTIYAIKANKQQQYNNYQNYLRMIEQLKRAYNLYNTIKTSVPDMLGYILSSISNNINRNNRHRIYNTGTLDRDDARYNDRKYIINSKSEADLRAEMASLEGWAELLDSNSIYYLPGMFDHFYSGKGGVYTDELLTLYVTGNSHTQEYIKETQRYYETLLKANKVDGIPNDPSSEFIRRNYRVLLGYDYGNGDKRTAEGRVPALYYPMSDTGLALAIHDWNSKEIYVQNFQDNDIGYSGELVYVFEDTFGLDRSDVSLWDNTVGGKYQYRMYGLYPGFQSWYQLQHNTRFDGKYKPFTTRVVITQPFEGTYD